MDAKAKEIQAEEEEEEQIKRKEEHVRRTKRSKKRRPKGKSPKPKNKNGNGHSDVRQPPRKKTRGKKRKIRRGWKRKRQQGRNWKKRRGRKRKRRRKRKRKKKHRRKRTKKHRKEAEEKANKDEEEKKKSEKQQQNVGKRAEEKGEETVIAIGIKNSRLTDEEKEKKQNMEKMEEVHERNKGNCEHSGNASNAKAIWIRHPELTARGAASGRGGKRLFQKHYEVGGVQLAVHEKPCIPPEGLGGHQTKRKRPWRKPQEEERPTPVPGPKTIGEEARFEKNNSYLKRAPALEKPEVDNLQNHEGCCWRPPTDYQNWHDLLYPYEGGQKTKKEDKETVEENLGMGFFKQFYLINFTPIPRHNLSRSLTPSTCRTKLALSHFKRPSQPPPPPLLFLGPTNDISLGSEPAAVETTNTTKPIQIIAGMENNQGCKWSHLHPRPNLPPTVLLSHLRTTRRRPQMGGRTTRRWHQWEDEQLGDAGTAQF
ncbi:hypothetical protein niasHT_031000 [Heterodera trifolii]|uniref:Uncharacterized protein n=1 Tax=Heterodera trifolii TaxID=157864 RepID=A0ABD2I8T7_9BILA